MKEKKYLPLYEKWMKSNWVEGGNGLCQHFEWQDKFSEFRLMMPTRNDLHELFKNNHNVTWWASDTSNPYNKEVGEFNTLRQTIVLFMAAMNDELD